LKSNTNGGETLGSDISVDVQLYGGMAEVTFKNLQIDFSQLPDWYKTGSDAGNLGNLSLNVYLTKPGYTVSRCFHAGKCDEPPEPENQDANIWGGDDGVIDFNESNWSQSANRTGDVFETRNNTTSPWVGSDFFASAELHEIGNENLQKSPHSSGGNAWSSYADVYMLNYMGPSINWYPVGTGTGKLEIRVTLASHDLANQTQYSEYVIPASHVNIIENENSGN
jgi:hypothetical protein